MKTRLLIIFVVGIIGFTGISFAEESPDSPIPEPEQESFTHTNCGPGTTYQDGICVVDETENSIKSSSGKWDTIQSIDLKSNLDVIPSPLKQMKLGIKLGHVICDKDKSSVVNIHYKPACVYSNSESELIKRGWAKLRLLLPAGPDPIKELDWMGRNVMSMMLEGTFSYNSTPVETLDEKRAAIWEYSQQYHPGEQYLEYAIIPHQNHYNVGDKVQFDLLEWGNYQDCWDLKLRIIDRHDESVYEDNSVRYCLEPDGKPGMFHSYSMGEQFDEFVCYKPGYYRIEVSNGNVFSPTILQNFACLEPESIPEPAPFPSKCKSGPAPNNEHYFDEDTCEWHLIQEPRVEAVFPYIWNAYLHKNSIDFSPQERSYANNEPGFHTDKENKVCSSLIAGDGTEFYISSTFDVEPLEIIEIIITQTQPENCQRIWKTDIILVEPTPELWGWLENYYDENEN